MIIPANGTNPYYPIPVMQQQPQQPQPTQYSNIVVTGVSREAAEQYPIAPGAGVLIIFDGGKGICSKTMGMSPLDKPQVKWYVEEEPTTETVKEQPNYENDILELREQMASLKEEIEKLNKQSNKRSTKEVDKNND